MKLPLKPAAILTIVIALSACSVWQRGFTFNVDGQPHQGLAYHVANQPDNIVGYAIVWDGEVIRCDTLTACERELRLLRKERAAGEIASTPELLRRPAPPDDGTGLPGSGTDLTGGAPGGA